MTGHTDWRDTGGTTPTNDGVIPLASVAALTAANRGLSFGEVDIPTNVALTVAQMTQANSDNVSIALRDMLSVFTNKAVNTERALGATGVMNPDGSLGHKTHLFFTTAAAFATDIQTALDYNGAHVTVNFTGGETIVMPPARYSGQLLTLRFNAGANIRELILNKTGISWAGMIRDSQHKVRASAPADNFAIYRPGEEVRLVGLGAGSPGWMIAPFTPQLFSGALWEETHDGRVNIATTANFATSIPAGQTNAIDLTLPLAATITTGTVVQLTDISAGAVALGNTISLAGNAAAIFAEHAPNRTATSIRLLARNPFGAAHTVGTVGVSVLKALPNYAALGGVASF